MEEQITKTLIISPHIHKLRLNFKNYIYSKCLNMKQEAKCTCFFYLISPLTFNLSTIWL